MLAGCGGAPPSPAAPPTAGAAADSGSRPGPAGALADLPHAPPIETWVRRGNDYQLTVDMQMQTALIELGAPPAVADAQAARDFAYHVCSGLRAHRAPAPTLVREAYPQVTTSQGVSLGLAAQGYCLDQF